MQNQLSVLGGYVPIQEKFGSATALPMEKDNEERTSLETR